MQSCPRLVVQVGLSWRADAPSRRSTSELDNRMQLRTLADWVAQLESIGFAVKSQPMSAGTPFANVLLVGRR